MRLRLVVGVVLMGLAIPAVGLAAPKQAEEGKKKSQGGDKQGKSPATKCEGTLHLSFPGGTDLSASGGKMYVQVALLGPGGEVIEEGTGEVKSVKTGSEAYNKVPLQYPKSRFEGTEERRIKVTITAKVGGSWKNLEGITDRVSMKDDPKNPGSQTLGTITLRMSEARPTPKPTLRSTPAAGS